MTPAVMFWLFARSRGLARILVAAVLVVAFIVIAPTEVVANPFHDQRGLLLVALAPVFAGMAWAMSVQNPFADLEGATGSARKATLRGAWTITTTIVFLVVVVAGGMIVSQTAEMPLMLARNMLLSMGVGGLAGLVLPRGAAWLPLGLYGILCALVGMVDLSGQARLWALPYYDAYSITAGVVAVSAWVVAAAIYVARDGTSVEPPPT
ncbi:hypothetical protein [Isoptericola croceus]|uniref:hypothetical protein n=1 Tax=Isoptericola croceus TaxID=3031406 RepID=UPI0023F73170|nr:hypothetical protein [Isoptericola croceus]